MYKPATKSEGRAYYVAFAISLQLINYVLGKSFIYTGGNRKAYTLYNP